MTARTVVHFEIPANDLPRLARFYEVCFGWTFTKVPAPGMEYWLIATGPRGRTLRGGMYPRMHEDDRPRNFVGVEDIDAAIRAFTGAGGTEVVGKREVPGQGWTFIGNDPEGNAIALFQPAGSNRPARRRARGRKPPRASARRARPRRRRASASRRSRA